MASSSTSSSATATLTEEAVREGVTETLKLKLKKTDKGKKIQWTEDTVDNEGEIFSKHPDRSRVVRSGQEEEQGLLPVQEAAGRPGRQLGRVRGGVR